MTKAIDETWRAADGVLVFSEPDDYDAIDFSRSGSTQSDRARLAACAPEALRLLLELESTSIRGDMVACPVCGASTYSTKEGVPVDHEADCAWLRLMWKAGLR